MSSTPAELPGFYYGAIAFYFLSLFHIFVIDYPSADFLWDADTEKKKYFKIEKSQTAPSSAQWSSASVKRRRVEFQAAEEASKKQQLIKNHVKRSVLRRDAVTSGLLARETGNQRTAEAGQGRPEDEDIAAAMWARGLTDKGQTALGPSRRRQEDSHTPCFYVSGKECGTESAIAYASKFLYFWRSLMSWMRGARGPTNINELDFLALNDDQLVGTYIDTDENEK